MQTQNTINHKDFKTFGKKLKMELSKINIELSLGATYNLLSRTMGCEDYNTYKASIGNQDNEAHSKVSDKLSISLSRVGIHQHDIQFFKKWFKQCPFVGIEDRIIQVALETNPNGTISKDDVICAIYDELINRALGMCGIDEDFHSMNIFDDFINSDRTKRIVLGYELKSLEEGDFNFLLAHELFDVTKGELDLAFKSILLLQNNAYTLKASSDQQTVFKHLFEEVRKTRGEIALNSEVPGSKFVLSLDLLGEIKKQVLTLKCTDKKDVEVPIMNYLGELGNGNMQVVLNKYFEQYIEMAIV